MSGEYAKVPLGPSLNQIAKKRAQDQIIIEGMELPCTVASVVSSNIVTVEFQVDGGHTTLNPVTVPVAASAYQRLPLKKGDPGVCVAASVSIGGVTGLGSGLPKLWVKPGNLSALFFIPLGTTNLSEVDPAAHVLFDQTMSTELAVTPTGVIVSGETPNLTVEGNLSAGNGISCSIPLPSGQILTITNGIVTGLS